MKRFLPQVSKVLVGTLCLILLTGSSSFAASSKTNNIKSIVTKQEITNIDILTKRAKNAISDIAINSLPRHNFKAKIHNDDGVTINIPTYQTSQVLQKTIYEDGTEKALLTVTTIAEVPATILSGGGSDYSYGWDSSGGVRAYSTNYYYYDNSSPTRYNLYRVTGGWNVHDGVATNRRVNYGNSGSMPGYTYYSQSGVIYPTGLTFSKNTGFTKYVTIGGAFDDTGNSMYTRITRGTSSAWDFYFDNNL